MQKMNKKIAFLILSVILATTIMITTTAVMLNKTPLISSIRTDAEEKFFDYANLSDRVQLQGDPIGGGWPRAIYGA